MKKIFTRRYRRSKSPPGEAMMFKKQQRRDNTFFAGPAQQTFFKPNAAIRRKSKLVEADETTLKHIQQIKQREKAAKTKIKQNIAYHFKKANEAVASFTAYAEGASNSLSNLNYSIDGLANSVLNALQASVRSATRLSPSPIAGLIGSLNPINLQDGLPHGASLGKKINSFLRKFEQTAISKFEEGSREWQNQIDAVDMFQKIRNAYPPQTVDALFARANPDDITMISQLAGVPDTANFSSFDRLYQNLVKQFNAWLQKTLVEYAVHNTNAASVINGAIGQRGKLGNDKKENVESPPAAGKKDGGAQKDETRAAKGKKNSSKP